MKSGKANFTLIDLLILIAIIAVLGSIIPPVLGRAQAKAQRTSCMVNMRDISRAAAIYTQEYDGWLPRHPQNLVWMKPLPKLRQIDVGLINCPTFNPHAESRLGTGFGFNLANAKYPAKGTVNSAYLWDGWDLDTKPAKLSAWPWIPSWIVWRHHDGTNIGFLDGHAKWYAQPTAEMPSTITGLAF